MPKSKQGLEKEVELSEGQSASYENGILKVKGERGEVQKKLLSKGIIFEVKDSRIKIKSKTSTKKDKKIISSFQAHTKVMSKGADEGHKYTLKICSGHFPMSVSVKNNQLSIKNFLGEKVPRELKIKEGADVKVDGDKIIVESTNKETAGQVSADIENLTKRTGYDYRIFQDGIHITIKDGKEMK